MNNYNVYLMTWREKLFTALFYCGICFAVGIIFYQNLWIALLISPLGLFYMKSRVRSLIERRKSRIALEFKQALFSLSTSLAAGKSLENGMKDVIHDLPQLFPENDCIVLKEFELIMRKVENGEPIEVTIANFAMRSGIEDLLNFSEVIIICKRTGGDLIEVIRRTTNLINEKMSIQQEISVMIAQKKLESRLLSVIPFALIALISMGSPDYVEPLFEGIGIVIMTFCLGWITFANWIIVKMMQIQV